MGISRIHLMVHYPSDVLCGAITGTLAGIIGTLIALRIPDNSIWYSWDLRKQRRKGAHE
jgi:membrane-associated phospholipid phosphatase